MSENRAWVSEALDYLDPALLEKLEGAAGTKVRRPVPVRVLLAAACICGALVIGAVAAEVAGFDFVKIFSKGVESGRGDSYQAGSVGLEYISLSKLSPQLQVLADQYKDVDFHQEFLSFDSWEEAEEYLGYEIADNDVLAGGSYVLTRYTSEGKSVKGNCVGMVIIKYGNIEQIELDSMYDLSFPRVFGGISSDISMMTNLYIGEGPSPLMDRSDGYFFGFNFQDSMEVEGQEGYLTANGLETVLVNLKSSQDDFSEHGAYHAHFFLHGIRFTLMAHYSGPEDQETVLAGLKQVLDAFE